MKYLDYSERFDFETGQIKMPQKSISSLLFLIAILLLALLIIEGVKQNRKYQFIGYKNGTKKPRRMHKI